MRARPLLVAFLALVPTYVAASHLAVAEDGGDTMTDAATDAVVTDSSAEKAAEGGAPKGGDGGTSSGDAGDEGEGDSSVPLACDGSLCATNNGSTCAVAGNTIGRPASDLASVAFLLPAVVLRLSRRARRGARRPGSSGASY
jgi:hypothetical protein